MNTSTSVVKRHPLVTCFVQTDALVVERLACVLTPKKWAN